MARRGQAGRVRVMRGTARQDRGPRWVLVVVLPIEDHRVSVWPDGTRRPCVYRYATEEQRARHLVVEARVLRERSGGR